MKFRVVQRVTAEHIYIVEAADQDAACELVEEDYGDHLPCREVEIYREVTDVSEHARAPTPPSGER